MPRARELPLAGTRSQGESLLPDSFELEGDDERFARLFFEAASRPPEGTGKIQTLESASLSEAPRGTTVGLTTYSQPDKGAGGPARQAITFYAGLIRELSELAVTAVIAHELAHAWLNEHVHPEESPSREHEADELARRWGFGPELDALDGEAETVNG